MIENYYEELVCDLAEVYHIYDIKAHDLLYIAILAKGLDVNSRVFAKINGFKVRYGMAQQLLTNDILNLLLWSKTDDGMHNRNRPKSMYDSCIEREDEHISFTSSEDFRKARDDLRKEILEERRAIYGGDA